MNARQATTWLLGRYVKAYSDPDNPANLERALMFLEGRDDELAAIVEDATASEQASRLALAEAVGGQVMK